ncbi:MAG: lytic transglycosylase domain-containing protein [Candidatus Velthaea sp.]
MIATVALSALLSSCSPSVAPDTMRAIVAVESGGHPTSVHDNDSGASYVPRDREEATRLAEALIARGHSVDLGLGQVNSRNLAAYGVTPGEVLEPCRNLRVASAILASDYRVASARFANVRAALTAAIGAYNTGSLFAGASYVQAVVAAAMAPRQLVPTIAILTGGAPEERAAPLPSSPAPAARPVPTRIAWGRP